MPPQPPPARVLALLPLLVAIFGLVLVVAEHGAAQPGPLDTAVISQAIGRAGQAAGGVYKVTFPRSDLHVAVGGVPIRPGLALTGWAAFEAVGREAVVHGDLALAETEVNPVVAKLRGEQVEITAIHNHLLGETPRVMYVHFWARGAAGRLAAAIKAAIDLTGTPAPGSAGPDAGAEVPGAARIQATLGLAGTTRGGVLSLAKPRPEAITMMGVPLPPSMGMATSMNFQSSGPGRVASTGDFVLTGDEVNPVVTALREHGIDVTALHNHMIHGTPELYFMHYWANGAPEQVAAGLKAALAAAGPGSPGMRH